MTALERIDQLYDDAIEEGQEIDQTSLAVARRYFAGQPADAPRPSITLTPEGRVRARWHSGDLRGAMREF